MPRQWLVTEVWLVFALSLGAAGVRALISLLADVAVAGHLLHRLRQFGWGDGRALALSAVVRGSHHLYQGLGGFVYLAGHVGWLPTPRHH